MKKTLIAAGSLLLASGVCGAATLDTDLGALGYLRLSLDNPHSLTRPQFGVALTGSRGTAPQRLTADPLSAPRLADVRLADGQVQEVWLNRTRFAVRDPGTGRLEAFGDMDDPATWVVGGILAFGVLCATNTWVCENHHPAPAPEPVPG